MTPVQTIRLLITGTLLISSASAFAADPVLTVRDWSLTDSTGGSGNICTMSVSARKGILKVETYTLQISKMKNNPLSPVEATVFLDHNRRGSKGIMVNAPSTSSDLPFSLLKSDGSDTFWGVARNLSGLFADLKSQSSVAVRGVGGDSGDVTFNFSAKGFTEVLAEMENRCNGGASILSAEFEQLFLSGVATSLDPTKISITTTGQLRALYFQAFPLFQKMKETQAGLRAVLAKYQGFIDEQAQVRATLSQLQNVDIPNNRAALAAAQKQQVEASAEISRLSALIPALQAQVQSTQNVFDSAQAILQPLVPEFNRLSQLLSNAQYSLSQAQARLSEIDSRLQSLVNELSSLRSESNSLQQATTQERYQLSDAQNQFSVAQSRRANFNVQREREERLRGNQEYSRMRDERAQLMPQAQQTEQQLNQVRGERARIAQMLEQCRASNIGGVSVVPVGLGQPMPVGPAPGPGADCSQYEQALANADRQIAELQNVSGQLQARLNDLNNRMGSIERQISQQVQRDYDQLVNRERECRDLVTRIEDQLQRDQNRLAQVINSEIPNREREQSRLLGERPQVVSQINQSNSDVNAASNQLASFRATNDWDRKKTAVDNAARDLRNAQNALASVQSQKSSAEARLQAGISDETQLRARIAGLEVRVASLSQRDAELVKLLANLPAERAPFDAKISELMGSITTLRDQFLNLIR